MDDWYACGQPGLRQLHIKLMPKNAPTDSLPEGGMLLPRLDHNLYAWISPKKP
jgi:hypothetical protein